MSWNSGLLSLVHRWRRHLIQGGTRGLLHLSERLGPEQLLALGRGLGWTASWPLRRRLARNLRSAGLTPTSAVLDRYFQLLGTWAGWSMAVYQKGFLASGIARGIRLDDSVAHLDRAVAEGKGVILATAHFFCHEIGAAAIHLRHPIAALIRESKDPLRQAIKDRWYEATGMEIVLRARRSSLLADTLAYLRVLRAGKVLAITPDLPMRRDQGVPVRMFGRQVILPSGMIALSIRSGAPVVSCWGEWRRDRCGRPVDVCVRFDEPMRFPPAKDREAIQRAGMQAWGSRCQEDLRKSPENWMFWLDKNWTRVLRTPAEAVPVAA
jgi:lauroyl/myristoyl acyltransferase